MTGTNALFVVMTIFRIPRTAEKYPQSAHDLVVKTSTDLNRYLAPPFQDGIGHHCRMVYSPLHQTDYVTKAKFVSN